MITNKTTSDPNCLPQGSQGEEGCRRAGEPRGGEEVLAARLQEVHRRQEARDHGVHQLVDGGPKVDRSISVSIYTGLQVCYRPTADYLVGRNHLILDCYCYRNGLLDRYFFLSTYTCIFNKNKHDSIMLTACLAVNRNIITSFEFE